MAHQELGYEMVEKIESQLADEAAVEQKPLMAGRNLSIVMRRK